MSVGQSCGRSSRPSRSMNCSTCTVQQTTVLLRPLQRWLGSRVVSVLDSGAVGPGFKLQPRRCQVTVLNKLFTPIAPLLPSSETGSSPLKGCEGNCGPGRKKLQPTTGLMTHVTCRLTADNRDQLRNPMLGNQVWASFFSFYIRSTYISRHLLLRTGGFCWCKVLLHTYLRYAAVYCSPHTIIQVNLG